jgi:serine/threonine-protein kinase mTOR
MRSWLKFASLCRKSNHVSLAQRILNNLLGYDPKRQASPHMIPVQRPVLFYAYMKFMWQVNEQGEAYRQLQQFVAANNRVRGNVNNPTVEFSKLLARLGHDRRILSKKMK